MTTERRQRVAWVVLAALAVAGCGAVAYSYLTRPPQMGPSEAVFDTVDALYTAVRNHDEKQLTACEARLAGYRTAGELPPAAAESLTAIIATARAGSWDSAAERLYAFMLAQRRDGATKPPAAKPKAKKG